MSVGEPTPAVLDVASLLGWLREFGVDVAREKQHLTQLDSAIGDADHGTNVDRGMTAVLATLAESPPESVGAMFKQVGMTLVSKVGGASGPLLGTFFLRFGTSVGDVDAIDAITFARSLRAGLDGVLARGKAEPGDKTMVDALGPALDALDAALANGADLGTALAAAADAAEAGRDATTPMLARKGRASYLGERSVGHQDPGATSSALLVRAAARTLA